MSWTDNSRRWLPEEDALLLSNIHLNPFPALDISRQIGRSLHSVKARAQRCRDAIRAQLREEGDLYILNKRQAPNRREAHAFHKAAPNTKTTLINCLGCQNPFKSWDVKKNRLCPKCGQKSEDPSHTRHTLKNGAH